MTTKSPVLDAELQRILETAADMAPIPNELKLQQTQSSWPWQVPQAPSYTTDHTPGQNHIK
jgi:hypothetical protein